MFRKISVISICVVLMTLNFMAAVTSQNAGYVEEDTCRKFSRHNEFFKELFFQWYPRKVSIKYVVKIENNGNSPVNMSSYLAVPQSTKNQILQGPIEYTPTPDGKDIDQWGQEVRYYLYNLSPKENITLSWKVNATTFYVRHILLPWKVGEDIPNDIREQYTVDDEKYKIGDPLIVEIINDVLNQSENIFFKALKLHDYVINNLEYDRDEKWDDAPTVLKKGKGSCSEYCFCYIALCRAAGIPARYIGGTICKKLPCIDEVFHRIVEIYLPNYGWMPVDLTRDEGFFKHLGFGALKNTYFVVSTGGGSSKFLDWHYLHGHDWEPKSNQNINISYYVQWY